MYPLMHHVSWSFLAKHQITQVTQPSYIQDLVLCDFQLFHKLKSPLKGKRFQTVDEIQENTTGNWWRFQQRNLQNVFNSGKCWEKCVRSHSAYFEGDWSVIVLCTMFFVSSSINISIFHITWLDTYWIDYIYIYYIYINFDFERDFNLLKICGDCHLKSSPQRSKNFLLETFSDLFYSKIYFGPRHDCQWDPFLLAFSLFLLLFKYSFLHFPTTTSPCPTHPPPPLKPTPLWLYPWVLYTCSLMTLPFLFPVIHPPSDYHQFLL